MSNKSKQGIELNRVQIDSEDFFRITNVDAMRPFFMTIVSDSNHWMFISSNGGLSAGRKNADYALFPYYTDDKITESIETTGSKSIFQVTKNQQSTVWEPFSLRNNEKFDTSRNLYKSVYGNQIIFEEINHDLGLVFKYRWSSSDRFGFVKTAELINTSEHSTQVSILDGLQNILPAGIGTATQNVKSNLVDAYKRSELAADFELGIFALSAIIVDKAEPSEALMANVAWSIGLPLPKYLVSSRQLDQFRNGAPIKQETDVKAEKGAFFVQSDLIFGPGENAEWLIVADVNLNHSAVARLSQELIKSDHLPQQIKADIARGTDQLIRLTAAADGLQTTADHLRDTRHFSNTLFNIMRGGIFDNNYQIEKWDFADYLQKANAQVYSKWSAFIDGLPDIFSIDDLLSKENQIDDPDMVRLCSEYLPLKFSRRHGDPSRPWNRFSINTKNEIDGSKILDYEGNWRDIFQNWEALAHAYPRFINGMILKFLNASTFEGYNPYRITKGGFDWEVIEPDDPWSFIGYWGDHQIIYMLKLLEFIEDYHPGHLNRYFDQEIFVYANVPYVIKDYSEILKNPKDTIEFNAAVDAQIRKRVNDLGADGAMLRDRNDEIVHVNFIEKVLASVLAKISNFIPNGGIWMNTQRPEWNDANNALVGNGVSMVTLYYLLRFLRFFEKLFSRHPREQFTLSAGLARVFEQTVDALTKYEHLLDRSLNNADRKAVLDALGQPASAFRKEVYQKGFDSSKQSINFTRLEEFVRVACRFLEYSIEANQRPDHLFHAYNLMTVENDDEVSIDHLSEMVEGQVAVLSSGYLSSTQVLEVLDSMKKSALYRADQYSYLLYPNKNLPGFLDKNLIPEERVMASTLLAQLVDDGNAQIIEKDVNGKYHFNGHFRNAKDLNKGLVNLAKTKYQHLVEKESQMVLDIYEEVFDHKSFTGRSGTFFGYEGLGSIYWHMVSKLQLAVMECFLKAVDQNESEEIVNRLLAHYYEINAGIGVHKSPELYGAFPTDPYSHTPAGKGAQQPGMTGQVKEDFISRFGELGVFVKGGQLTFKPSLLRKAEFGNAESKFEYIDVSGQKRELKLEPSSLAFTTCQIPIIYQIAESNSLEVFFCDGTSKHMEKLTLSVETSQKIFGRTGEVKRIHVSIIERILR